MYTEKMVVKDEHIDFQGIMDGLYYPWYMEEVRHNFLKVELGIDIVEASKKDNINYVLASIDNMNFKRPIKKGASLTVSCELKKINNKKFGFYQTITVEHKIVCDASFTATCIPSSGGRAFIPDNLKTILDELENSD